MSFLLKPRTLNSNQPVIIHRLFAPNHADWNFLNCLFLRISILNFWYKYRSDPKKSSLRYESFNFLTSNANVQPEMIILWTHFHSSLGLGNYKSSFSRAPIRYTLISRLITNMKISLLNHYCFNLTIGNMKYSIVLTITV